MKPNELAIFLLKEGGKTGVYEPPKRFEKVRERDKELLREAHGMLDRAQKHRDLIMVLLFLNRVEKKMAINWRHSNVAKRLDDLWRMFDDNENYPDKEH